MGIPGLLRVLKDVITVIRIEDYKGKVVAVDAMVWYVHGVSACGGKPCCLCRCLGLMFSCECGMPARLHRAIYTLGRDLANVCEAQYEARVAGKEGREEDPRLEAMLDAGADRFVRYVMDMVHVLTNAGVIPYLVFDGDSLPAKKATEADRLAYANRAVGLNRKISRVRFRYVPQVP